jgi:uncharacterized protein YybS (DUF2232 family)
MAQAVPLFAFFAAKALSRTWAIAFILMFVTFLTALTLLVFANALEGGSIFSLVNRD